MDVRCRESRATVPKKGRRRLKRPGLAWAAGLLVVAVAAIVALGATSARADNAYTWTVDAPTDGQFTNILGTTDPINGRYAGRVWTDKTVKHEDGSDIFKTTFSALGSSRTIHSTTSNPLDVVFIVDVSGSMTESSGTTTRIAAATSALNSAVSSLMKANPNNRIAVTTFAQSSGSDPFVALGHYDGASFTYSNGSLSVSGVGKDNSVQVTGGTNTQQGIYRGMQILANVKDPTVNVVDAVTQEEVAVQRIPAVVLLSDGQPTYSMNESDWWDLASTNDRVGPGSGSFYGNGMLAIMEASYQKGQINKAYGVDATSGYAAKMYTVRVGSLTGNNLNLANVTLDPTQYLSVDNDMSNGVRTAWETYRAGGTPAVLVDQTESGPWWNPSVDDVTVILNHPSSDDITSLAYNDGAYVAGTDDLGGVFENIILQLQQAAFSPVTDSMGGNITPLTYSDPIGQYMAVTSVDSVELFGTTYKVRPDNDGTYSVLGNGTVNHPVYGTPVDVSNIKIEVKTTGEGAEATQVLTCQIPADILPVRVETITYAADGTQTFTSNRDEDAAQPLRLNYSVGFSDDVKPNGSVDLTKVSAEYKAAHRNADGGIDFYSNTYSAKTESEPYADPDNPGTVGDATATFAPSKENRFYYFQANRTIYSSGTEGVQREGGSVDESTTLGSVSDLDDDGTYYLVIDYHEGGAKPRLVNYVVARTGAELKNSVEVVDGVVKTKIGAPRLGNTNRFTEVKAADATGIANATGTASLAYAPTYVYSDGAGSDYQVQVNLGNNGRVTVPATAVRVQKDVEAAAGVTAPDQEFTFTVTAPGRSGEETLPVFELQDDGSWAQSVDGFGNPVTQKVVWADGATTVTLKAGQSVLVEMADGVQWTVTEDELGSQPANGTFSLTGREGANGAAATEDNGRQIAGTAAAGSVQQAIFTNAYTTSTTWTTGTHGSILLTKDMEGNLASGDPRGFRVGDHFSFEVSPNEGAPLPRADRADGSGDFAVTSVEVGVAAVNTETGDDGGQRTTYDLEYVYRGADGEVSSQMVREKGLPAFSASFPGIVFDRPGDYVYTVRESRATAQNVVAGVTYDPSVYRFTVHVGTDTSGSKLQVSGVSVEKRGADSTEYQPVDGYGANNPVTFVNEYRTTDVRRFFGVTKTLTGAPLDEGRFSFTLTGEGAHAMTDDEVAALPENGMTREQAAGYSYDGRLGQPMPDGVSGNTATTTNGAGGVVSFGGIRFEQASAYVGENPTADDLRRGVVYKYTVVENVPEGATDNSLNGITYDTTSHDIYVYVHVEDSETEGEIVRSQVVYGHDHGTGDAGASSVPFVNSYEATGSATINGTKTMNGRTFREGDTFTFTLSERSANTGVETVLQTKTLTVGAEDEGKNSLPVSFDPISYIHNGTKSDLGLHTYVLREVEPDEGKLPGVSYDTAPRVVTVNVTDNGDGTLATPVTYPADADAVTWTNRYTAPTATVTLPGTKTFNGGPIPAQSFGFSTWTTGSDYNTEGVAPYQTWVGAGTSVDKDGTVTSTATVGNGNLLSSSSYKPGDYYFVVAENAGTSAGVSYDTARYQVHLTVTDKFDGTATAELEVRKSTDGGNSWSEWSGPGEGGLDFTNTFEGVPQAVAQLSKVTLNSTVPAEGYGFTLSIQRQDDSGQWVAAKAGEVYVKDIDANADGTYSLKSDATGTIPMGDLVFLREGTYRTALVEVLPNGDRVELGNGTAVVDGMAYDTHTASATYTVTRNGTSLVVRRDGADTLAFINDGGMPVSKAVYADGVEDAASLPQGPFTFTVSGLGEDQTAYLVVNGADEAVALKNGSTFELSGGQSGRIYGLGQNGTITLTESDQDGFTADGAELTGSAVSGAAADGMAFRNKYTPGAATQQFSVSKELTGRGFKDDESFTFTLMGEGDAPMPAGGGTVTVNENNGKATFGEITYDKVGTYTYTVQERAGEDADGLKYDRSVYTVKVDVTYDEETKALKSDTTYTKDGQPYNLVDNAMAFTNTYESTGKLTDDDAAKLDVTKTLTGRDMTDGQFTFAVEPVDTDDAKASEKLGAVELHSVAAKAGEPAKAVDAAGKTLGDLLGAVTFDQNDAGKTFSWKVSENGTDNPAAGYTMDTAVYTVSIEVTDNLDGTVTATPSITKDGEDANAVAFANAYTPAPVTTSVTDTITVNKTMEGRALEADEFTFELVDEGGAVVATGTNDANGKVVLDSLTYDKVGEYKYTLREAKGSLDRVDYDTASYPVVVTVTDDGNGKLVATHAIEGSSDTTVTFKNTYTPEPIHSSVTENVTVTKALTGRDLRDGEFKFELVDSKGDVVATGANDADGKVTMDAVEYTAPGTHEYTLREVNNGIPGMSYDPKTYKVTVEVTADLTTGALSATSIFDAESVTFSNTYDADSVSDYVAVAKTLDGRKLQEGEFTFQIVAGDQTITAANDADGKATLGPINFTKAGTYTYKVSEVEPAENKLAGVTYDGRTYDVVFTVTDDGNGQLAVSHVVQGAEDNVAAFKNVYTPGPIDYSVTSSIDVTKSLDGRDLMAGEFGFELVDGEGNVKATGTNDASGKVTMDAVEYTKPGEYKYTLREADNGLAGVTYDKATYDVTVTVKADDVTGALSAEAVVAGGPAVFTNTYNADAANTTLSVSKQLTGRGFLEGETFSFTLAARGGAPMPAAGGETATVSENLQQAAFGAITFTTPGEYRYTISEVGGGSTKDGVAYDGSTFTATVKVRDNTLTGRLEVDSVTYTNDATGAAASIPSFINRYTSTGSMDGVASVNVSKVLTGRPMAAGQFAFSVTPADDASSAKLPAQTLTNQASDTSGTPAAVVTAKGEALSELFSGVTFTEADAGKTFAWTVAETSGAAPGYTVDQHKHTVEVEVADNGNGTITATTYVNGDAVTGSHALIAFENGYHAESNPDAAEGSGRVTTTKTLHNRDLAGGEFTFQMRDAKGTVVATVPNAADGTVDFGAVKYTSEQALADVASGVAAQVGTADKPVYRYTYTLSEVTDALPENVSAEVPTVTVTVDVADNGDGTMTCSVVWPSDGAPTGFVNAYEADPLPVTISGTKVFTAPEGLSVPESVYGAFTFTLTDEDGNVLGTATNDRSGSVAFPEITYTQDDLAGGTECTFTYTVTETGSVPGITNDAAPTRTVTVHLSQGKDGHLSTRVEGMPFTFTNTYSVEAITTSVTDQVKVTKSLTGRSLADGEFEFRLVDESGEVAASGTNAADGTVTMSPVTYTEPGVHTYTLSEVAGDKPGVGYDDAVYTVTTTVVDNGDGTLSATHKVTGGEAVFNNTFTPTPVVDPAFGVAAKKVLVGRDWTEDDAFTFVTVAETENAPMPDPATVVATKASPMGTFGAVVFSEPGTYSYLVSETAGDEEHMTYSQALYRVVYEVAKDEATGELSMSTSVTRIKSDDGADVDEACPADAPMEFVNTYSKPAEPVVPEEPQKPADKLPEPVKAVVLPVTGLIAKTGDVVAPLLPWIGVGAAAVTAGALRILKGGRRRKD